MHFSMTSKATALFEGLTLKWLDELLQCCDPDLWNGHLSAGERDLSLLSAT